MQGKTIKKSSHVRTLYYDRHSRILHQNRRRRRQRALKQQNRPRKAPRVGVWRAPRVFCLAIIDERRRLLRSLVDLRRRIAIEREATCLDFSATTKMNAEGALLFVAELFRLKRYVGSSVLLTCKLSLNHKICQVLKQVGVLDALGITEVVKPVDADVVNWRYAHGERVLGEKYEDVLKDYDGEITEALQTELYTGITEAMTNVLNHAYAYRRQDTITVDNRDWWMFSQQMNGFLSVVFCDLGAGIPRTLPAKQPTLWERIKRLGKTADAFTIEYAVKDSISRTGEEHRGKGLGQIVRVIENVAGGTVVIHSNCGAYVVSDTGNKLMHYSDNILGTLIYWRIPLHSEAAS